MSEATYYSKTERAKTPLRTFGMVKIPTGFIILIIAFFGISRHLDFIINTMNNGNPEVILPNIIILIVNFILLFVGMGMMFGSVKHLKNLIISPHVPPPFQNYENVVDTFLEGKMDIYRMPSRGPLKLAYQYISDKVPFLTPQARKVVEGVVRSGKRFITFLIVLIVLFTFQSIIPDEIYREAGISSRFGFPVIFFLGLIILILPGFISIKYIIPGYIPKNEFSEEIVSVEGGGDPNLFSQEIEKAYYNLRHKGLPNRKYKTGFKKVEDLNLEDTGSYSGRVIIETHPKIMGVNNASGAFFFIASGVLGALLGAGVISSISTYLNSPETLISGLITLTGGIIFFKTGTANFSRAELLLNTYKFESLLTFIDVEGTIGKTEVTAGKAINDSLESRNVSIRSDSQLKMYTAKVLTESYTLHGPRYISAMINDADAQHAEQLVKERIQEFQSQGLTIRGVNVNSETVSNLSQANAYIQQKKRQNNMLQQGSQEKSNPHLLEGDNTEQEDDTKKCPRCAETIKKEAKMCRFCGYEIEKM